MTSYFHISSPQDPARLEEADAILRQAISLRGDYVDAYINRGDILLKMNRTEEAVQVYKKALEFNADNPDVHYNLAIVHLEKQEREKALEYFNNALLIKPDHQVTQGELVNVNNISILCISCIEFLTFFHIYPLMVHFFPYLSSNDPLFSIFIL